MGSYLDTPNGRAERRERQRWMGLYDAYFTAGQYLNTREWKSLLGYKVDIEPPTLVVNYPRLFVERPAHFAFDRVKGAEAEDGELQGFLNDVLLSSGIIERLYELAIEASVKGDALLVFDFDPKSPDDPFPIKLVKAEDYTIEADPHDASRIRFVRIEYRYLDESGAEVWYRQELHPDKIMSFKAEPVRGRGIWATGSGLDLLGIAPEEPVDWRLTSLKKNEFGFIPAVLVKNRARSGEVYGRSDLADLLTLFDDLNWKLSQRSRNISRTMNAILKNINGRILNDVISEDTVLNVIGENADVSYLVNDADMREIATHIGDLRRAMSEISGVTVLDPEKLTGLGSLSGFALSVLYEPLIALAEKKRRVIGGGVERLLSLILRSVAKLGMFEGEPESFKVKLNYGAMFNQSEAELFDRQARLLAGLEAGVLSREHVTQQLGSN